MIVDSSTAGNSAGAITSEAREHVCSFYLGFHAVSLLGLVCADLVMKFVAVLLYVSQPIGSLCWWVFFGWTVHSPKAVKIANIVSFLYVTA